jgi:hypothetical protein
VRLPEGGTISVQEWPAGELVPVAKRIEGNEGVLLLEIADDLGSPTDTVSMHGDESDRVTLISRAIVALENARDALKAAGYVDYQDRIRVS